MRYRAPKKLSPAQLAERMDVVLDATQRAIRQVPREHLGMKYPGRDRTVHQLGFHVFRVAASYADTREQGNLDGAWFEENAPPEMADGDAVARYGETVRQRLRAYFARPGWCDGEVSTYYGPQSAPEFMERTTWHSAQHLRQIYWFLDELRRGEGRAAHRRRPRGAAVPDGGLVVAGWLRAPSPCPLPLRGRGFLFLMKA